MKRTWMIRLLGVALGGLVITASPVLATSASAAGNSSVSVVHGIPGQPVDVYVNGDKTVADFQPATVAGPLSLPAGTYDVALTKPGAPVDQAILRNDAVEVPGGANLSLVAHLDESGSPTLTAFANDTSRIAAGQARLIVRHTAAAPAVDVRAGGEPVFKGLTNPNEAKADIPAGTVEADVVLAGTDTVVLGPQELNLQAGTVTIVYAIGSANDKTLALVAQTITNLGAPGGVPAGGGGLADTGVDSRWYVAAGALLLLALIGTAWRMTTAGTVAPKR